MNMKFNWLSIIKPSGLFASIDEIKEFEHDLGFSLPDEFCDFILRINGGRITCEHEIPLPDLSTTIDLRYLYPLSAKTPFLGLREGRITQVSARIGIRQMLQIGGDAGTGFFFLMLDGESKGAIYFSYKDDVQLTQEDAWLSGKLVIPDGMVEVASNFDKLGNVILANCVG